MRSFRSLICLKGFNRAVSALVAFEARAAYVARDMKRNARVLAFVAVGLVATTALLVGCGQPKQSAGDASTREAEAADTADKPASPPPYDLSLPLQAYGNTPYWSLEVYERRTSFRLFEHDGLELPKARVTDLENGRLYEVGSGATAVSMTVTRQVCRDSASGELLPATAVVRVGEAGYRGCVRPHPVPKADSDWIAELYDFAPALRGCLKRAPAGASVSVARWSGGRIQARLSRGDQRYECVATGSGEVRGFSSYSEAAVIPGDRRILFWAPDSTPERNPACRTDVQQVIDGQDRRLGWLSQDHC
jgi:uncharacterized membrane protein